MYKKLKQYMKMMYLKMFGGFGEKTLEMQKMKILYLTWL